MTDIFALVDQKLNLLDEITTTHYNTKPEDDFEQFLERERLFNIQKTQIKNEVHEILQSNPTFKYILQLKKYGIM